MAINFKQTHKMKLPFSRFSFKKLKNLIEKLSLEILLEARATHRFISRTNNLERAIKNNIKNTPKKITSRFFIDEKIANYGKYIHNGFKSWKPDKFLENPFNTKVKLLQKLIKQEMKR